MKVVDLFSGCGGLSYGFKEERANIIAHLEINKACCDTLSANFSNETKLFQEDVRNTKNYLSSEKGSLLDLVKKSGGIDMLIGGPPCQAYSIAGRIRDSQGMNNDYRNFLFESFVENLRTLKPKAFLFENVAGMLSAKPNGISISSLIKKEFSDVGFEVLEDFRDSLLEMSEIGLPQKRTRLIIFGVNRELTHNTKDVVKNFYGKLGSLKKRNTTVRDAISHLPALFQLKDKSATKIISHSQLSGNQVPDHFPRYHNSRDIKIFELLASDIESGRYEYTSVEKMKELYTRETGKSSNIHKYHVVEWNKPSNTITAHLCKDGLRYIHPDAKQARSLTVREAAYLQGFPGNYKFKGPQGEKYKMIGNAVPPLISRYLAKVCKEVIV